MNAKPWLPVVATILVGSHLVAVKLAHMRERAFGPPARAAASSDVKFGTMGPNKLWSSIATRMIHVVEEFSSIAIAALFVGGMVGLLVGA